MPLAFSEGQLEQIKTFAYQLPRHLCSQYLHHLARLLPRDFGDADVWRAAHKAVQEVMHAATRGEERALGSRLSWAKAQPHARPTAPGHFSAAPVFPRGERR
jgi:hypothetical protein